MRQSFRRLCALSAAALIGPLGLAIPPAVATPIPGAPPLPSAPPSDSTAQRVHVVVLLKDQPTGLSAAAENDRLAAQRSLLAEWTGPFGLELDRQFGYLANGFSASMPVDRMNAL